MNDNKVQISLSLDELRFIISSGLALIQHVPEKSLPTYCGFDKAEIIDFALRMRKELDELGEDM